MLESRQILNARLEHQLGTLVSSVEIAIRANLASSNVAAENTLMELLNRIYGWKLVNANSISQNYAGVDLIDEKQQIAAQITSTRTTEKVRHTQAEVSALGIPFQRVIVLFISNRPVTQTMKDCAGTMELWNIPDVYRAAIALDTDRLREIIALMDRELGTIRGTLEKLPHLELPIGSRLQSSGFVGREEELEKIRSRFAAGDKLVVLTGLGGMGKTELAVHYAREHSGMVHFVRFDTSFTRTLANMAQSIRPSLSEDALREDESARSRRVLALLKESHSGDLLIIDNADGDTGNLADLQMDPGYAALVGLPLKLLITTRSYFPRAIRVEPMSEENLKKIFCNHGTALNDGEMTDLTRAVNGHTMTIDLIARTLTAPGWRQVRAEQILTALREHTLPSQKYQKITTDYSQSPEQAQIYTHLSVVFDLSGVPEDGQQVLRCATLLPEDGMDAEVFGLSLEEAQQNALDDLLERGWLETNGGLLTIHPVIRIVCRTELRPTGGDCDDFLISLTAQCDGKDFRKDVFYQTAELLTNASHFLKGEQAGYAMGAGELWRNVGEYAKALDCDLLAKDIMKGMLSPEDPGLALLYNNIGCNYNYLGDHHKSLKYHEKALKIRKKILSVDDPALALSYDNAGSSYNSLGERMKALEYQQKALAIIENALPPEHPDLAEYYSNIGVTLGALGDHRGALEYYRKALEITENILPPEHPHLADYYNNASYSHSYLGNHQKALEFQLKALAIREKVLPDNHPDIASSNNNVAWLHHGAGERKEAARYMRRAAEIIEKSSLPESHPNRVNYPNWADQFEKEANMQQTMMTQMQE